jgi:sugar transferase (PEP-CTERM/EpsH1 system associated)
MQDKPPLLFLAHRIPYPPNKGDKIRSFHLLKHLSEHFSIYLGTFVDDEDDWQYCAAVRRYCADACFERRRPRLHKLLGVRGLLMGEALTITYHRSSEMQRWVDRVVCDNDIEKAFVFCSSMAQFVASSRDASITLKNTVIDFVDVDSEKWRQYSEKKAALMGYLYRREAATLLDKERALALEAYRSFFVSKEEAELFLCRAPECTEKIGYFSNGVDTRYFHPDAQLKNPYPPGARVLVFTGAMDYEPNIDAVTWFAKEVLPALRLRDVDLQFWVVGGKPVDTVTALNRRDGITVTGRVPDVRPYLQHAVAAVAPMRIARGLQNKVLEAIAMGLPVLASSDAIVGIDVDSLGCLFECNGPQDFVSAMQLVESEVDEGRYVDSMRYVNSSCQWRARVEPLIAELLTL